MHSGDDGTLLHYRIMISDYGDKTEVTVTDILPEGATFMADSVVLRLHPNNWNAFTAETDNPYYIQNVTVTPNLDGTTTVTFLIGHLNDLENHTFGIYYDVSVASDAQLIEAGEKTYLNVASWDGNTDSTLTTVEYHLPHLEKMGEQLPDMDVLRYYVCLLYTSSAFAGREHVLHAYHEAVEKRYRFFSFGDCMILL